MDFSLFELFDDPVVVINRKDLSVVFANSQAKKVFCGEGEKCYSVIYGNQAPCDEQEELICPLKEAVKGDERSSFSVHIVNLRGNYKIFLIKSYSLSEELYAEVFMDITRIQKDIGLFHNLYYLRLFEKGPVVVFVWKNEEGWPVSYVSKNVEELLGFSREEFITGKVSYGELIHPEDIERVAHEVKVYSESGVPYWEHEDYRLRTKYGVYIWVYDYTVPVRDEDGNITSYVGYLLDVSDKHHEWELFKTLSEASPIGIFLRCDFRLVYANQRLAEITEYSVNELTRFEDIADLVYEEDKEKLREIIKRRLKGESGVKSYELRIKTKRGRIKWVQITSNLVKHKGKLCSIGSVMDISERKRYEKKLEWLSMRDALTGLYNRRAMEEFVKVEVNKAMREGSGFGLIVIDLDNFKDINDTYGHVVGDEALKHVAKILQSVVRKSDLVGRWGGDEFVVLLPTSDMSRVEKVSKRICEVICNNRLNEHIGISVSVGASAYRPGDSVDSLLIRADKALYRAKRLGKNRVEVL